MNRTIMLSQLNQLYINPSISPHLANLPLYSNPLFSISNQLYFQVFSSNQILIEKMAMTHLNFEALRNLHDSANHLLHSAQTKQSLLHQEKWVDGVCEASLTMLDVCSISKDVLSLVKEHAQDLRSTLRRSNSGETGECSDPIAAYNNVRRKLRKETVKCLRSLKGMQNRSISLDSLPTNHSLNVVVEMLREVRATIIAIVESMSTLISIPWLEGKSSRGSLTTMLMGSRGRSVEDVWDEIHTANKRLEAVEIAIEDLEMEIDCMFRRLIQTRASLLNLLTY